MSKASKSTIKGFLSWVIIAIIAIAFNIIRAYAEPEHINVLARMLYFALAIATMVLAATLPANRAWGLIVVAIVHGMFYYGDSVANNTGDESISLFRIIFFVVNFAVVGLVDKPQET
ncbi:MAG: hypothetical protein DHS20C13_08690 [Thermodesulfobacteriota bacterium]|nr:MAG: hypothetical protein DHS20C13_08690 [Thermodesulfobacteriota bacterium]